MFTRLCVFLFQENTERLKMLPPPAVAVSYYTAGDLYFFDDFQVRLTSY